MLILAQSLSKIKIIKTDFITVLIYIENTLTCFKVFISYVPV